MKTSIHYSEEICKRLEAKKIDGNHFALCDGIHQYDHAYDI